ncbi:MAG: penicillin-binding protein 2, partial [Simkania negevensis]|nr:penicillin-binding protein 2 [Simkania negevensis]
EELLSLTFEEKKSISEALEKKSRSRRLKSWLGEEERKKIEKWWRPFAKKEKLLSNSLYFIDDYQRSYPYGKLLGNLLHAVREERDPATFQNIPTGGLELIFDRYLQGKIGRKLLLRSPRGPLEEGKILAYPENGADVYLTIDPYLQAIAEEEIEKGVKKFGAKNGWAILLDPHNGEILAFAQYPFFDPRQYAKYYSDPELLTFTKVRAITDCFEPGSTMKPITMAIALKANQVLKEQGKKPLFDPKEKIATLDGRFPGRTAPIRDIGTHRYLNMDLAIQKSSNIYVARLVQRMIEVMGEDWYRRQLTEIFGFGTKTGIELPSESSGFVPTPGKTYVNGHLEWSTPTPYSLAFGYNLMASSLQMVRAYAMMLNGGYVIQPTIVKKIVKETTQGKKEILYKRKGKEEKREKKLDPEISCELIYALKSVTKIGGTCVRADIPGYTEGGKSSTVEKLVGGSYSKQVHTSSFIGFAPATHPAFILLVTLDEPEYRLSPGIARTHLGGKCAAPLFRDILLRTFAYLGIPPDDPYGYPAGDPRHDPKKADWMEEVKVLKNLYAEWNR